MISSIELVLTWCSPLLYLILFLFGLIFGSFLNVILDRSRLSISWVKGRSRCDHCQQLIAWYDNIPLLSFVLLKGKCRFCQKLIGIKHPLIEFLTGLVFVLAGFLAVTSTFFEHWSVTMALVFMLSLISVFWLIFLFDVQQGIIPDELVILTLLLAIWRYVFLLIRSAMTLNQFWIELMAAAIFLVLFLALRFVPEKIWQRPGLGWGDIKLTVPLALVLGFPQVIIGFFCGFIIGGIWGIILLVAKFKRFGQTVPFGPFLILGATIGLMWGQQLWQWYWHLL